MGTKPTDAQHRRFRPFATIGSLVVALVLALLLVTIGVPQVVATTCGIFAFLITWQAAIRWTSSASTSDDE